ncbi:MAG: methyl-accepting chemotaxis protein [Ruminiclostridium sp.]
MKSVGRKILICSVLMVAISLVVMGIFSCLMIYNNTMSMVENDMIVAAKLASQRVNWELTAYKNIAVELGVMPDFSKASATNEDKQAILDQAIAQHELQGATFTDRNGYALDGNNYKDREYFQRAIEGKTTVTEPTVSRKTNELSVIVAAPVWADGKEGSTVIGCVMIVPDSEFLNDIVRDVQISPNCHAYMIDSNGYTIADIDSELVKNKENLEEQAANDASQAGLLSACQKMRSGETGFVQYNINGGIEYLAYTPVENTSGWAFGVYAPSDDFMSGTNTAILLTIIFVVVCCAIAVVISIILGKSIGSSVRLCTERIEKLAQGDLNSPVPEIKKNDETGILSAATKTVVESQKNIINDIGRILEAMSQGNLDVHTSQGKEYYLGDYKQLLVFLKDINHKLSATMSHINTAADQVSVGADQVSSGAQALSQGATEQASSVEELAATISVVAEMINANAADAEQANNKTGEAGSKMQNATVRMDDLVSAMNEISESSDQVKKIIKTIEDIAFQTNILALNAAVEAARAGEAGKGFAVVADEVRNLASKSAEAAKNTNAMIEGSLTAIEKGNDLVDEVASMMGEVSEAAMAVASINAQISNVSKEAADSIRQISVGIDQISTVVQTNSATAEESAAASEELSGQAAMLKDLIGAFTLRQEDE